MLSINLSLLCQFSASCEDVLFATHVWSFCVGLSWSLSTRNSTSTTQKGSRAKVNVISGEMDSHDDILTDGILNVFRIFATNEKVVRPTSFIQLQMNNQESIVDHSTGFNLASNALHTTSATGGI